MTAWGRDPSAGRWMYGLPTSTLAVLLLTAGAAGWLGHWQAQRLSPLQQEKLPTLVKATLAAGAGLGPMEYTLLSLKGPRHNADVRDYLTRTVYDGVPLWRLFWGPVAVCSAGLLFLIPAGLADLKRGVERRQGRYLKGARWLSARAFNRAVRPRDWRHWGRREAAGHRIRQEGAPSLVLPWRIEHSHASIVADSGGGKTTLLHEYCEQVERRGETAIIYDADGTYMKTWWKAERGDVLLSPGDVRTWAWNSGDEVRDPLEAMALATALVPKDKVETNKFFTNSARQIVAYLLALKQSPQQMVAWLTDQERLMELLKGTEIQDVLPRESGGQRSGVMSPLNMVAVSLGLCPTVRECGGRIWSAARWAETRRGWIFVTGTPAMREQLQPIQTLWFDALILRMLSVPGPPVKLCLDELASLQKLWQLPTVLAEGRKHGVSVVFGFQGRGQLEEIYGKQTETMCSQAAAQYTLRVSEGRAAETASKNIGSQEVERIEESRQAGYRRAGVSYSLRRVVEPLFLPSEIQGWEDRRGVLKVRNAVTTLQVPIVRRAARTEALVPRVARIVRRRPAEDEWSLTASVSQSHLRVE